MSYLIVTNITKHNISIIYITIIIIQLYNLVEYYRSY